jgi:predicted alpha/beta superfamily hydrolase
MLNIEGKTVELFGPRNPGAPLVVLNGEAGEGAEVVNAARGLTDMDFALAAVSGLCWEDDLTPWPIPPMAKGQAPCAGKADAYIELLTGRILPKVLEALPTEPAYIALAGYSLAGLFALWAGYQADCFDGIAAASPSIWFPDFLEYMRDHKICTEAVYLSLGDREEKTKNPLMSQVGNAIRDAETILKKDGKECILEWNKGNHFKQPDLRTAKAFAWLMNR